jgi:hypothetical protein
VAYQDIKPGRVWFARTDDPFLSQLLREYQQLAQEVRTCHQHIQQFPVAIANGLTTIAVTFPIPTKTTAYVVAGSPEFNAGAWFVSGKSTTGCTLTWVTASVGAQQFTLLVVE